MLSSSNSRDFCLTMTPFSWGYLQRIKLPGSLRHSFGFRPLLFLMVTPLVSQQNVANFAQASHVFEEQLVTIRPAYWCNHFIAVTVSWSCFTVMFHCHASMSCFTVMFHCPSGLAGPTRLLSTVANTNLNQHKLGNRIQHTSLLLNIS